MENLRPMKQLIAVALAALVLFEIPASAGIGSKTTMYVGGTLPIKEGTEGTCSTADEKVFVF